MLHYTAEEEFQGDSLVAIKKICDRKDEKIHDHDFVEIVYIIEGTGRHYVNDEEFVIKAGDLLFVNYGCTHSFIVDNQVVAYNLMVRVDYFIQNMIKESNLFYMLALTSFEKIQHELNDKCPLVSFDFAERNEMLMYFKCIENELASESIGRVPILDSYINIILCKVFRKIFVGESEQSSSIPQEILDYIAEHFNEKLSLNDLAQKCFYSPTYFSRLFKKSFNMSFTDYIMDIRLQHCCELLKKSDYTIERIIEECGFFDKNTFYERFKNKYGCTPREYCGGGGGIISIF